MPTPRPHDYFLLLRPKQWIKNVFVLAPLVFTGQFLLLGAVINACLTMLGFCLAASFIYIINDLCDYEQDRQHPLKVATRPIAAGRINRRQALMCASALLPLLAIGSCFLPQAFAVIWGYILLNLAYSAKLKHLPLIDIFCIAIGFVLRVLAGALALAVPLSTWMFITTLCLALFLASIKRQKELERYQLKAQPNKAARQVLKYYTLPLIKRYAEVSAISTLMFYSFFVITSNPAMALSIPVVIFGIFRYWLVTETTDLGESPTDLVWRDPTLVITLVVWFVVVVHALWPL